MVNFASIWLASFADHRMSGALHRLGRQASSFGIKKEHICLFTEEELDPEFREKFSHRLILGSKGYGYWCWKPQVVLQMFKRMPENEILLYLDAGCHLNSHGKQRFHYYTDVADRFGLCGFQYYSLIGNQTYDPEHHIYLEREFTKGDIFKYFNVQDCDMIYNTAQFCGGIFLVKNTSQNRQFFKNYLNIFENHWNLIDDSSSLFPNFPEFKDNRHDQSIFSIMMKIMHAPSFSAFECEHLLHHAKGKYIHDRNWGRDSFEEMLEFPIHARRDKSSGLWAYIPIRLRLRFRRIRWTIYKKIKGYLFPNH